MAFFVVMGMGKIGVAKSFITLIIPIIPTIKTQKKEPLFQEALRWATRIRTWNDRTRICSVTITP